MISPMFKDLVEDNEKIRDLINIHGESLNRDEKEALVEDIVEIRLMIGNKLLDEGKLFPFEIRTSWPLALIGQQTVIKWGEDHGLMIKFLGHGLIMVGIN